MGPSALKVEDQKATLFLKSVWHSRIKSKRKTKRTCNRGCNTNQVLLFFSIFLKGNKWLILTRTGCCLNGPQKYKKFNVKFSSRLKIKLTRQNVLILFGRLYLGKFTQILLNGFFINMDQNFGLFWHWETSKFVSLQKIA